jgi:hypothetical protein
VSYYLALSASGVVLLGLGWLLAQLVRPDSDDDTPIWWHVTITAALFTAATGLTAYMVW